MTPAGARPQGRYLQRLLNRAGTRLGLARRSRRHRECHRLEAVISNLPQGVVSVEDGADLVTLNPALLHEGRQMTLADFRDLTTRRASTSRWWIDDLIEELMTLTPAKVFQDDCSLIQLTFD